MPAATHASPWALIQVGPHELASPPVEHVSGIRGLIRGVFWERLTAGGVQVQSTKVDGGNGKVHGEVQAFAVLEGVAAVGTDVQTETL